MNTNKIIGWVLLVVGLMLIIIPLILTLNVFLGNGLSYKILQSPKMELNKNVAPTDLQKQVENAFMKALPIDLIYQTLNLVAWVLLLMVFIFGGKHIASLGIQLIKQ